MTEELLEKRARLAELEEEREELAEDLAEIRGQLERANLLRKTEGVSPDREWWHKAKHALRMKGIDHQSVLREAADLRRQIARLESKLDLAERPKPFNYYFRQAAEELLNDETYEAVRKRAKTLEAAS